MHWCLFCAGAEVYLNVKNEACSERARVKLICKGVDLVGLHWRYSNSIEDVNVEIFLVDAFPQNITNNKNPAFLSVQLVTVSRFPESNRSAANFFSILAVDILELEKQGITSITCGDARTYEEKLVSDITVWDLFNTKITAVYKLEALTSIEIHLRNIVSHVIIGHNYTQSCNTMIMATSLVNVFFNSDVHRDNQWVR